MQGARNGLRPVRSILSPDAARLHPARIALAGSLLFAFRLQTAWFPLAITAQAIGYDRQFTWTLWITGIIFVIRFSRAGDAAAALNHVLGILSRGVADRLFVELVPEYSSWPIATANPWQSTSLECSERGCPASATGP
jgi:hypothetical protein